MSRQSVFEQDHSLKTKSGLRAVWCRWVIERPNPNPKGEDTSPWVAVLDDSVVKNHLNNPGLLWDFEHFDTIFHVLRGQPFLPVGVEMEWVFGIFRCDERLVENVLKDKNRNTNMRLPDDASQRAQQWCGQGAVIAFEHDIQLLSTTRPLAKPPKTPNDFLGVLPWMVQSINKEVMAKTGLGWGMTGCEQGVETNRNPNSDAHSRALRHKMWGQPEPWDLSTGRIHLSLMASYQPPS